MEKLKIPENWSGKEALIVHDFLADVIELIWENYEDSMVVTLLSEQNNTADEIECPQTDKFNDEIPF